MAVARVLLSIIALALRIAGRLLLTVSRVVRVTSRLMTFVVPVCVALVVAAVLSGTRDVSAQTGVACGDKVFEAAFSCQTAQNSKTRSNVDLCCAAVATAEAQQCFCDSVVETTLGSAVITQLAISFEAMGCGAVTAGAACSNAAGTGGAAARPLQPTPSSPSSGFLVPPPPPSFGGTTTGGTAPLDPLASHPLLDGLEGYWFLNAPRDTNVAVDASGHGNHGIFEGDIQFQQQGASSANGVPSTAAGFNGLNTYVTVPFSPELNTQSFSISVWTKPYNSEGMQPKDSDDGSIFPFQAVVESTDVFNGHGFMLTRLGTSELHGPSYWSVILGTAGESGSIALRSESNALRDIWYHVVATYNNVSRKLTLYVDGIEDSSGNLDAQVSPRTYAANTRAALRIGGGNAANVYSGDISHVGVWDRELSTDEVLRLFLSGAPDVFDGSVLPNRDNARTAGGSTSNVNGSNARTATSSDTENDNLILIIIIAIVGVILLLAILILLFLLWRRRKRENSKSSSRLSRSSTLDMAPGGKGSPLLQDDEALLESIHVPLSTTRTTHAPTVARKMTNTFDQEAPPQESDGVDDYDVEDSTSGRRKPRFTRKGSRIHVRFQT